MGSPAMNVLEGSLEREGDALVCRVGTAAFVLPPEVLATRPALASQVGKPIAVGIRPEALDEPGHHEGRDGGRLRGRVQAVEALGPEQLVHVEIDAKPVLVEDVLAGAADPDGDEDLAEIGIETDGSRATVVARLEASAIVRPDEPIELAVDLRHLHFFDLDSGEAIGA
jgi:multiple sugar transport system ATP-binding protein